MAEAREINPELRALAFLNSADAQGKDNADAREALVEVPGIEMLEAIVVRRKAFPNAASQGRSLATSRQSKKSLFWQRLLFDNVCISE